MHRMMWVMVIAAALSAPAFATNAATDSLELILEQQQALRADLDEERVPEITKRQANAIRKAQAVVFTLVEGKSRLAELTIEEKVKLDNALERINAELQGTHAARAGQDQCRRERRSGSQLESTQCASADERDRVRENSRNTLEKRHVCGGPGCG